MKQIPLSLLLPLFWACHEARRWVRARPKGSTFAETWAACERTDWLDWLRIAAGIVRPVRPVRPGALYVNLWDTTPDQYRAQISGAAVERGLIKKALARDEVRIETPNYEPKTVDARDLFLVPKARIRDLSAARLQNRIEHPEQFVRDPAAQARLRTVCQIEKERRAGL